MGESRNKIIVALDNLSYKMALEIAASLSGLVWGFKITDLLFESTNIISKLKKFGHVFADAKLNDIPKTVENEVKKLSALGADLITVHASGGYEMMLAAKNAAEQSQIVAVTVLTSLDEITAKNIFNKNIKDIVLDFAKEAQRASLDGLVCSGQELLYLKDLDKLKKVVPGVRSNWFSESSDQKRTITPYEAVSLGADFLVIGRPILNSGNPVEAVRKILAEIDSF